uniref:WIPF2 protein n=1 Tax=Junco hyemalis TaxID=40217 RepID=A0A8C5IBH2_JUNHY
MLRNGGRDAPPPPPPYRLHGPAEPPSRGKPPPPPTRTPAGPPPPPPPVRNGHRDSISTVRAFLDDFESKYSFHPVEDFPAPEEYKYFQRIYPSKTNRGEDETLRINPKHWHSDPAELKVPLVLHVSAADPGGDSGENGMLVYF